MINSPQLPSLFSFSWSRALDQLFLANCLQAQPWWTDRNRTANIYFSLQSQTASGSNKYLKWEAEDVIAQILRAACAQLCVSPRANSTFYELELPRQCYLAPLQQREGGVFGPPPCYLSLWWGLARLLVWCDETWQACAVLSETWRSGRARADVHEVKCLRCANLIYWCQD